MDSADSRKVAPRKVASTGLGPYFSDWERAKRVTRAHESQLEHRRRRANYVPGLSILRVFGWLSDHRTQAKLEDTMWHLRKQAREMREPKPSDPKLSESTVTWILRWRVCATILQYALDAVGDWTRRIAAIVRPPSRPQA